MERVTLNILNIQIQVDWAEGKNLQYFLEKARDSSVATPEKFDFALQYYGNEGTDYLGYMIIMMLDNQHFDNYNNNNRYWEYKINGKSANWGIDNEMINSGDKVEFTYKVPDLTQPHTVGLKVKLASQKTLL